MRNVLAALIAALVFVESAHAQASSPTAPPPSAPAQNLPNCSASEHHALDFWIGEWDAYRADNNRLVGRSSITASDGGCVINERWNSLNVAYSGRSLNMFNRISGHWEQYWVDSTGAHIYFVGGAIAGGAIQMTTTAPDPFSADEHNAAQYQRVTFTPNGDGSLTQQGDQSLDGHTWTQQYRFIYRPHRGE